MIVKWMKRVQFHTDSLAHLFGHDESRDESESRLQSHSGSLTRTIKSKKGMTMAEVLVTMVLMVIFLTATYRVMADALGVYYKMKALDNAKQTIDTLMDKVIGEIEGAQVGMNMKDAAVEGVEDKNPTLIISADNSKISLYDRTSSSIYITSDDEDKRLMIYYNEVSSGAGVRYKAVKWKFDEAAYMGYDLEDLKFYLAGDDYPRNVIKVYMKLTSPRYGSYDTTRFVECYNFDEAQDLLKIKQE